MEIPLLAQVYQSGQAFGQYLTQTGQSASQAILSTQARTSPGQSFITASAQQQQPAPQPVYRPAPQAVTQPVSQEELAQARPSYAQQYAGYEHLIVRTPTGYDVRAADVARASAERQSELQRLTPFGEARYGFQRAGAQQREYAERIQAAHGDLTRQEALLPGYRAATEREWAAGLTLERMMPTVSVARALTGAPGIYPARPLEIRGMPDLGATVPPDMQRIIPIPRVKTAAEAGLVAVGWESMVSSRLPETVTITEPPIFTIPFTGISIGGGQKTIPTSEYLQKYETVGPGSLISGAPVRLKGEYAPWYEQPFRWLEKTEKSLTWQMEETGTPFYGLRQYGVPVPSFGRIPQLQREYWPAVYGRAETLPSGMREFVQTGAAVAEYWRGHPLETAVSFAAAEVLTTGIPVLSRYAAAAPVGSFAARAAPYAGAAMTWGTRAIIGLWGIQSAERLYESPTPRTFGTIAGETLPWVTPYYISHVPQAATSTIGWFTGRVPEVPLWRALSAEEFRPIRRGSVLETEIRTIDVRGIEPREVPVFDVRPVIDVREVPFVTTSAITMPEIMSSKPPIQTVDPILELMQARSAIEIPRGRVDLASDITLRAVADLDAEYGVISRTPTIAVAEAALATETITPISIARLGYPFVTVASAEAVAERLVPVSAAILRERATVAEIGLQVPAIAGLTREDITVIPRFAFPPSEVQIPREDITIVPRFGFPPDIPSIRIPDTPPPPIPRIDIPPPPTVPYLPGWGQMPAGGGISSGTRRAMKKWFEILPLESPFPDMDFGLRPRRRSSRTTRSKGSRSRVQDFLEGRL